MHCRLYLSTDHRQCNERDNSDIHLDLLYKPGSNARCDDLLCCRGNNETTLPSNTIEGDEAGAWGHYQCDVSVSVPLFLLSSFIMFND
jgi:hypothetical protein